MSAASSRVAGSSQMSTSVAWVSALIGLKLMLPHSFSQISERMSVRTGALRPAATSVAETFLTRALSLPSSSPTGKRSPSRCRMTPGAAISPAG